MNLFQALKAALTSAVTSLTSDRAKVEDSDLLLFDELSEARGQPALARRYELQSALENARRRFFMLRALVRNSAPALFDATEAALKEAETEGRRLAGELKAAESAALKAEREVAPRIERVATRHAEMLARIESMAADADAREAAANARFASAVADGTDSGYDLDADRAKSEKARSALAFERSGADVLGRELARLRADAAAAEEAAAVRIGELRDKLRKVESEAGALEWDRAASALMLAGMRVGDALPRGRLAVPVFDPSRVIGGDALGVYPCDLLDDDALKHIRTCAAAGSWSDWRAEAAEVLAKVAEAVAAHESPDAALKA